MCVGSRRACYRNPSRGLHTGSCWSETLGMTWRVPSESSNQCHPRCPPWTTARRLSTPAPTTTGSPGAYSLSTDVERDSHLTQER